MNNLLAPHVMVIEYADDNRPVTIIHPVMDVQPGESYESFLDRVFQHTVNVNPQYQGHKYYVMPVEMLPTENGKYLDRNAWRMRNGKLVIDPNKKDTKTPNG